MKDIPANIVAYIHECIRVAETALEQIDKELCRLTRTSGWGKAYNETRLWRSDFEMRKARLMKMLEGK